MDFRDLCVETTTALWCWIGSELGEDMLEDMFRYILRQCAWRQCLTTASILTAYPRFHVMLLAKYSWRAHSCFGAGQYPGKFAITEDDEKFSFHLTPCGSGGRLLLKGGYGPPRGARFTEQPHWWTHSRSGFPYYCIHCCFVNEIVPFETFGYLLWPLDLTHHASGEYCIWHVYKDPNKIPAEYYQRLGFQKKTVSALPPKHPKKRYFSDPELAELSRPLPDRIVECLNNGDSRKARRLCSEAKDEFLFLHDLYVNAMACTLTFIAAKKGEQGLEQALQYQYDKCVRQQWVSKATSLSLQELLSLLALKLLGADACNGKGLPSARYTVTEDDESITFILDPCGSGGRLLRSGVYAPFPLWKKWMEKIIDSIIIASGRYLPLNDSLLYWAYLGTYGGGTSQRKPFDQGITEKAHPWSFQRKGVPYFCCFCGMMQDRLGTSCLTITPPRTSHSPCVWKIQKRSGRGLP
ncbi:MAG: hypothetical protein QUS33_14975 [Dehalococcoidia bacterium]|nr:hypothetical protein [Dehalococcoidia bacterium]